MANSKFKKTLTFRINIRLYFLKNYAFLKKNNEFLQNLENVNSYSLNFSEYHKSNINPVKNYQIHSCFPSVVLKNEYINRTKKLRISRIFDLITYLCLFFYRNKCTDE